jgi:hypothetical protein
VPAQCRWLYLPLSVHHQLFLFLLVLKRIVVL